MGPVLSEVTEGKSEGKSPVPVLTYKGKSPVPELPAFLDPTSEAHYTHLLRLVMPLYTANNTQSSKFLRDQAERDIHARWID